MTTTSTASTGTVATAGSTTYIASTASGLDTSSLIASAVATKTAVADTIDAEVTANKNKISAYTDVQTLLASMSSAIDGLASATNLSAGSTSAFDGTQATLSSSDASTSASSLLSVSTTSTASDGTYALTITQLAKSMKVAGSTMSGGAALGLTGSFTLAAADGTAATVSVTSGMTLSNIASAISAQSATTGVNATLVKVSDDSYKLVLTSADTGEAITASTTSGDDVLTGIGLTASDGSFANVVQAAQDAVITLDGTTISRSSNAMTDVIPGVTLDLDATTATGASVTLTVSQDTSAITTAIQNFVSAYNNLHDYLETQESVGSDGTVSSTAYLFADSTLRELNTSLGSALTSASGSGASSSAVSYLTQLGLSIDSSGDLKLDTTTLADQLSSNASAVQGFFQSSYTTSNSSLLLLKNSSTSTLSFTLDIAAGSSGITGATVNGQSGLFTVSGNELIGVAGTAYAGLTFAISATSSQSIDINLKQGFADSVVSIASQFGNTSSGLIQNNISSLTSIDTSLSARSAQIREDATTYQSSLVTKYANMETEISSAKILQQEIEAVINGSGSSS